MKDTLAAYWKLRLARCQSALADNHFDAFVAENAAAAGHIVLETIFPQLVVKTASWGDSMTLHETGVLDEMRRSPDIDVIETFDRNVSREKIIERRRQALQVDLFLTGSNAVTETGTLVNLDMVGNRIGGITFGPRHVIIFAGRNKIVSDIADAMARIKHFAAPANAIRHTRFKTPCMKTACCRDCKSLDRICNTWAITEKSFPKGRIKVILINQDLGL